MALLLSSLCYLLLIYSQNVLAIWYIMELLRFTVFYGIFLRFWNIYYDFLRIYKTPDPDPESGKRHGWARVRVRARIFVYNYPHYGRSL